jgi:hypothetical protein
MNWPFEKAQSMLGFGSPPLKLPIGGETVQFKNPCDFEFALAGRTSIPSDKISQLVSMSDPDLLREAEGIRKLEQRFSEILSAALEASEPVGPILQALDMSLVTQDNDWRPIIETLNDTASRFEPFKRVALVKYMQYLRARQDVIRILYSQRQLDRAEAATQMLGADNGSAKMRETLIFDLSENGSDDNDDGGLRRLPKGETIEVSVPVDGGITLRLTRHECIIQVEDGQLTFTDDVGSVTNLEEGRHVVGRGDNCEIALHPGYRDISRKHLIIECKAGRTVGLTDVSALGTFVSPEVLGR